MKKSYSFFHKNITTKLFIVNGLVCIALGLVVIVVLFSFQNVKEILSTVFARQAEQAIENAQIGRGLARILFDTNLLNVTFYGKDEFYLPDGVCNPYLPDGGAHLPDGVCNPYLPDGITCRTGLPAGRGLQPRP